MAKFLVTYCAGPEHDRPTYAVEIEAESEGEAGEKWDASHDCMDAELILIEEIEE